MVIIEDTRQKVNKHNTKHSCFDEMGVQLNRCALPFGDYAKPPVRSVDTKENMLEIANNIIHDHVRFREECIKALQAGCRLFVLVENTDGISDINDVHTWANPNAIYHSNAIDGSRLEKSMKTMEKKYNVKFVFCPPEESAKFILEILNGEHDE